MGRLAIVVGLVACCVQCGGMATSAAPPVEPLSAPEKWAENERNCTIRTTVVTISDEDESDKFPGIHLKFDLDPKSSRGVKRIDPNFDIKEALKEKCSLNVKMQPLAELLQSISRDWKIKLVIDTAELKQEAEQLQKRVTVKVDSVSRKSVLKSVLKPDLGYFARGDELVITTKAKSARFQTIRTYTVADLAATDGELDKLSARIMDSVERDSWQEHGGIGTVRPYSKTRALVIRQTEEVHEQVTAMLIGIREEQKLRNRDKAPD